MTSLIVYRIWYTSRAIPDTPLEIGQGATRRAMMLIVESGALYLLFQLVFVILFAIPHPAEAILAVMAVQIYVRNTSSDVDPSKRVLSLSQGIAPTLIIIRVGLGISSENTSGVVLSTRIKWIARHGQDTGTSATHYTDGLVTNTDSEGMKESGMSKSGRNEHDTELDVFAFETRRTESIPSPA